LKEGWRRTGRSRRVEERDEGAFPARPGRGLDGYPGLKLFPHLLPPPSAAAVRLLKQKKRRDRKKGSRRRKSWGGRKRKRGI